MINNFWFQKRLSSQEENHSAQQSPNNQSAINQQSIAIQSKFIKAR